MIREGEGEIKSMRNFRQSSELYKSAKQSLLQTILKALEWHKMQVSSSQ